MTDVKLWPEPEQMKAYLDSWVARVTELESQVNQAATNAKREKETLAVHVADLQNKIASQETLLLRQIHDLEAQVQQKDVAVVALRTELDNAVTRIATGLDIAPTKRGLTIGVLIGDALLLIDEAKRQFRESL